MSAPVILLFSAHILFVVHILEHVQKHFFCHITELVVPDRAEYSVHILHIVRALYFYPINSVRSIKMLRGSRCMVSHIANSKCKVFQYFWAFAMITFRLS